MSYWKNKDEESIEQTSVSIPSVNGLSYNAGQRIDIVVPNSVDLFDGRASYLKADVLIQNNTARHTRLQLDPVLGGQVLIKNIRIFGMNTLLEEISGYNGKVNIEYSYDSDNSLRNMRALKEGCLTPIPDCRGTKGTSISNLINHKYNPYYKAKVEVTQTVNWDNTDFISAKLCLPLHTGIFADSLQAFPNHLFGENGIRIEIDLEDSDVVIKQLDSVNRNRKIKQNPIFHGVTFAGGDWANDDTATEYIYLTADNNITEAGNVPFVVGEFINFCNVDDETQTSSLQIDAGPNTKEHPQILEIDYDNNFVRLKLNKVFRNPATANESRTIKQNTFAVYSTTIDSGTYQTDDDITKIIDPQTSFDVKYTVSNVELIIARLGLTDSQKAQVNKDMRDGGSMELDILSVTNYRHSLLKENRVATINLPISNTRAKSMIILNCDSTFYNSAQKIGCINTYVVTKRVAGVPALSRDGMVRSNQTSYSGCINNLTNYQMNISDTLTPSRPVDVSRCNKGYGISAQKITEDDKGLLQSRIVPRSFKCFNENFIISRAYALNDGVTNLNNRTNQIQLNYNETSEPEVNLLINAYCFHIRRIVVTGNDVRVEL
tara:strand:+ start:786 stop:2597 length:1812 start_codon:yes stop_codon:yes gene_type:complete